jgi:hypothetical protein
VWGEKKGTLEGFFVVVVRWQRHQVHLCTYEFMKDMVICIRMTHRKGLTLPILVIAIALVVDN